MRNGSKFKGARNFETWARRAAIIIMDSPSLPMDVRDINVCLLSAKKKRSTSSPSLRELDQMSLCNFPTSSSVSDNLSLAAGELQTASTSAMQSGSRKRVHPDYDTMSVDMSIREPHSKKIRRPLTRVANLMQNSPFRQAKRSLKRSLSFSKEPAKSPASKYRIPGTPKARAYNTIRRSKLTIKKTRLPQNWVDTVSGDVETYSKAEVKRQEAIYSIFRTESELVEDLRMVINIFFHPLLRLNLMSAEDHCKIFGNIQTILELHEDFVQKLQELKTHGESISAVGSALLEWSKTLEPYADYCANLVVAKHALDAKKQDPAFEDFLQRCLDSEFSRKIDLWTFLDSPRSRIMKYPILLKEVIKKTPSDHPDQEDLGHAVTSFNSLLKAIDHRTGVAKCLNVVSRLDYLHDEQRCSEIEESQFILCSGILRNKSGSKLHAFLFDKAFVLTRPTTRTSTLNYQVYRQPIPVAKLQIEDIGDGESRLAGGSFRGALRSSAGAASSKYLFKISCSDPQVSRHSHTLQANGDFDKKAWIDAFKAVVPAILTPSTVTTV